jgi:hypothetical protein
MDIITVPRRSLVDVVETRRARDVASSDASTPIVVSFDSIRFDALRRFRDRPRARVVASVSRATRRFGRARARRPRVDVCRARARVARATRADAVVHKSKTPRVGYRDSALGKIT